MQFVLSHITRGKRLLRHSFFLECRRFEWHGCRCRHYREGAASFTLLMLPCSDQSANHFPSAFFTRVTVFLLLLHLLVVGWKCTRDSQCLPHKCCPVFKRTVALFSEDPAAKAWVFTSKGPKIRIRGQRSLIGPFQWVTVTMDTNMLSTVGIFMSFSNGAHTYKSSSSDTYRYHMGCGLTPPIENVCIGAMVATTDSNCDNVNSSKRRVRSF